MDVNDDNGEVISIEAIFTPTKVETYVQSWIEQHGVALEMKVAGAFRTRTGYGLSLCTVDHGQPYATVDPNTGTRKWRETDVVVRRTKITEANVWLTVWIIIECKSDKSSPWILYRDSAQFTGHRYDPFGSLWELKFNEKINPMNIGGFSSSELLSGFGVSSCYSISTATKNDSKGNARNPARDSLLQVVSALEGLRESAALDEYRAHINVFMPVVITSAPIFAITLALDGSYSTEEISRALFHGQVDPEKASPNSIWVISESELDKFADEILQEVAHLDYRSF